MLLKWQNCTVIACKIINCFISKLSRNSESDLVQKCWGVGKLHQNISALEKNQLNRVWYFRFSYVIPSSRGLVIRIYRNGQTLILVTETCVSKLWTPFMELKALTGPYHKFVSIEIGRRFRCNFNSEACCYGRVSMASSNMVT